MRSNGVLAPASDPGSFPGGMVSCGGYQYDGGQASSNHPLNMQCEGVGTFKALCIVTDDTHVQGSLRH